MAEGFAGCGHELLAAFVAVAGGFGQDPGEDVVDGGGQVGAEHSGHDGGFFDVRPDDGGVEVLLERDAAGQAFVQDAAERVLVGEAEEDMPRICSGAT